MTIPASANPLLLKAPAGGGGYAIERSLRFNSSDSAYLSRTPASAGNLRTYTWSGWIKRSALGSGSYYLFSAVNGANADLLGFQADSLYWNNAYSGAVTSTDKFRDPSAWYHIVFAVDSTQSTDSDRVKMYANGRQITNFSSTLWPSLNRDFAVNAAVAHQIGRYFTTSSSNFYLADIHFIDGQALDPTSFGEFDANGIWQPIEYTGSYGTNGFHLDFADNSSAAALGYDAAGSNDWTVNNLSVTAGAGNDSLVDVPTNGTETDTGLGGEVRGNYCTWNPLGAGTNVALSNGNLDATSNTNAWRQIKGTIGVTSGKWYWECTNTGSNSSTDNQYHGISNDLETPATSLGTVSGYCYGDGGDKYAAGTNTGGAGATYTNGDVIGMALDLDSGTQTIKFYKNGTLQFTQNISGSGPWYPASNCYYSQTGPIFVSNFGQRPFAYPVSGYKALCTANLPAPVVTKPSEYMDIALYTGNGSTQTISGLEFSPDLVWIKARSTSAYNHFLLDTVRGVNNELNSNTTDSEYTRPAPGSLTAFNSDGFDLNTATGVNASSVTYASWNWDAGTSNATNTSGTITSTCRANISAGFSIVTYNGSGVATVGHGLGAKPSFIIVKNRDNAFSWQVYHESLGATKYLILQLTNAAATSIERWNDTEPTSSVFTIGTNGQVGGNCVAYCFAPVEGYSAFGSYTGNGSADGPFVYTGFRPKWLLIKIAAGNVANWYLLDGVRNTYNVVDSLLRPNIADAEVSAVAVDFLSNGFKLRNTDTGANASGNTYIYAAFAENPFALNARAR